MPRSTGQPAIKTDPDHDEVMIMQDGDEIVREIDVYLSPAMESQLYLMQYPLQHHRPADAALPKAARIKKSHGMIELDERITTSPTEQQQGLFSLSHRTSTSHTIPVSTHMALGKLDGTTLHLVPLSHIVQMRPSFEHINNNNDNNNTSNDPMEEEETTPITLEKKPILFQKKETERAALARKSSFAYKKSSEESEPWQMLFVCGSDTIQYDEAMNKVTCGSSSTTTSLLVCDDTRNTNNVSYVQSLNYLEQVETTTTTTTTTVQQENPDMNTVCVQLVTLLQHGCPVPYSVLSNKFPFSQWLVPSLLSTCIMVRGNFVLQSRFLTSMPLPLLEVRSFALFVLQMYGHVERVRLMAVFPNISEETITMVLNQVAHKQQCGGTSTSSCWQFKLSDNIDFYSQFPQQCQLYEQYWERQAIRFSNQFELYKNAV